MPDQPIAYQPIRGINVEDTAVSLQNGQIPTSLNFLFYGQEAKTRPGLQTLAIGSLAEAVRWGFSFITSASANPKIIVIGASTGKLFQVAWATWGASEVTGAGITWSSDAYRGMAIVNGVALLGNSTGGLVRWDPAGATYTVLSSAKYRYVTGHFSRAVAAYDISASALIGPRTVAWSKPGDEGVWNTAGGTDGSGSTCLADAPDDITGVFNLHNVVVVARRRGFHLGYPTASSISPFRWESWSYRSRGVYWDKSAVVFDNKLYYMSEDNVNVFDLETITPIGREIRKDLFAPVLGLGTTRYQGFVTRCVIADVPHTFYHLVDITTGHTSYSYDIDEGTWSKHNYAPAGVNSSFNSAFELVFPTPESTPLFIDSAATPSMNLWHGDYACESASTLTGPTHVVGDETIDADVQRVLLRARDYNNTKQITLTLYAKQNDTAVNTSQARVIGVGVNDADWIRAWYELRLSGQLFKLKIDVPAGAKCAVDKYILQVNETGRYRG